MKFFLLDILITYFLFLFITTEGVSLNSLKNFPIYEDEEYILQFNTKFENLSLYTAIILHCYKKDVLLEEFVLSPGYLKGLPKLLYGDYFSVLKYTVKPFLIEVVLTFKRKSNEAVLRIMYIETESESVRQAILNDKNKQKENVVDNITIILRLHWILNFVQKTLDHREGGLVVGSVGILICRASDGYPYSPATITGVKTLREVSASSITANKSLNEAIFAFLPTIEDHLKKIVCKAGPDEFETSLKIFHHPKTITIVPAINGFMHNDTTVLCKSSDGYPTPISKWTFLKGPPNAELFYSLKETDKILYLNKNAPKGSKWSFQCSVANNIPNSLNGGTRQTVNFIVGDVPRPIVLIICLITLVLILLLIIAIVVLRYRSGKCSRRKKEPLTNGSSTDQGIFFESHGGDKKPLTKMKSMDLGLSYDENSLKKKSLIPSLDHSNCDKQSFNSSLNGSKHKNPSLKENNPVDLV